MSTVVLLSSDLLLQSQVTSKASATGAEMPVASTATMKAIVESRRPHAIAIDLASVGDVAQVVADCKTVAPEGCLIWAFGPHVGVARLSAAREAGCDWVTSRGDFLQRISERLVELEFRSS